MIRLLIGIWILLLLVLCLPLLNTVVDIPATQAVSQFLHATFDSRTIRNQYGTYGRKYSDDYKQYRQEQLEQRSVDRSLPIPLASDSSSSDRNPIQNNSNPKTLNNPQGIHGNNYSLYDINSPTGHLGKM